MDFLDLQKHNSAGQCKPHLANNEAIVGSGVGRESPFLGGIRRQVLRLSLGVGIDALRQ